MSLHPVIQMQLAGTDIITVPPENIVSFNFEDNWLVEHDKVTLHFYDPTYVEFDNKIMFAVKSRKGTLRFRWGYPETVNDCYWRTIYLEEYIPQISDTGMFITMSGSSFAQECEDVSIVSPKVYSGKISSVAKQIAKDLKFKDKDIYVEETDDDGREGKNIVTANPSDLFDESVKVGKKAVWATGNQSLVGFISKRLQSIAHSKENPGSAYDFKLNAKGEFHFHTKEYIVKKSKEVKTFTFLFGKTDNGITWTPEFYPGTPGMHIRDILSGTYDPLTKRYIQRAVNHKFSDLVSKKDDATLKSVGTFLFGTEEEVRKKCNARIMLPSKSVAVGGHCSGKKDHVHTSSEEALKEIYLAYYRLQKLTHTGTLTVFNTDVDDLTNFDSIQTYCNVRCVLPDGSLHWSSGKYLIESITHEIDNVYRVVIKVSNYGIYDGSATVAKGKAKDNTIKVKV